MSLLSCQVFTLHLPPTIVVSLPRNRRIAFVITLLSGRAALWGNYRLGNRNFPAALRFSHSRRRFLHWIPHFGGRVPVEFRSAVGYVFSWTCWLCQGRDLRTGVTHVAGWFSQSGLFGWMPDYSREVSELAELRRVNRLDHLPIPYRDADVGFSEPEPMQMGRSRLSLEEKWRRA